MPYTTRRRRYRTRQEYQEDQARTTPEQEVRDAVRNSIPRVLKDMLPLYMKVAVSCGKYSLGNTLSEEELKEIAKSELLIAIEEMGYSSRGGLQASRKTLRNRRKMARRRQIKREAKANGTFSTTAN